MGRTEKVYTIGGTHWFSVEDAVMFIIISSQDMK